MEKTKAKVPISSLRFSFMFPCPIECITQKKDLKNIIDAKYKGLTHRKNMNTAIKNVSRIKKKALKYTN